MEAISKEVWTYVDGNDELQLQDIAQIRQGPGFLVRNYRELMERVAALSFKNPEFVLFYRGQQHDFHDFNNATTLYPSIFRARDHLSGEELFNRFNKLSKAEEEISRRYDYPEEGARRIKTYRILRWSIIQHYEICATPLLDVTHSLRVACSFAHTEGAQGESFIYVLGLPQISGSVTASSEHGIQIIRLLSICPPRALRPHYQEGYLIGDFPTIGYREKLEYERGEVDFAQRLICKFRLLDKQHFWDDDFQAIPARYLYPDERDTFLSFTIGIKESLNETLDNPSPQFPH